MDKYIKSPKHLREIDVGNVILIIIREVFISLTVAGTAASVLYLLLKP